jgi:hypothetical protein
VISTAHNSDILQVRFRMRADFVGTNILSDGMSILERDNIEGGSSLLRIV